MTMTETRQKVTLLWDAVRCKETLTEGKRQGERCNKLLVLVAVDRHEALSDALGGFCDRCGKPYNLGDYRDS